MTIGAAKPARPVPPVPAAIPDLAVRGAVDEVLLAVAGDVGQGEAVVGVGADRPAGRRGGGAVGGQLLRHGGDDGGGEVAVVVGVGAGVVGGGGLVAEAGRVGGLAVAVVAGVGLGPAPGRRRGQPGAGPVGDVLGHVGVDVGALRGGLGSGRG